MGLLGIFLSLIFLGFPIAFALLLMPTAYVLITGKYSINLIAYTMYNQVGQFPLIAIPLFLFAGTLTTEIGLTSRLVSFSQQVVGRLRGGLALTTILSSALFSGLSGSILANTATMGTIFIPEMKKEGYSGPWACALVCSVASIDAYIPPSIPIVVYCTVVPGISIGAMFIAGFVAGALVAFLQAVVAYLYSIKRNYPKHEAPFHIKDFALSFIRSLPGIICIILIIWGMRAGAFNATEIAVILCVYVLAIGFFWYGTLTLKILIGCLFDSVIMTGMIIMILAAAGPFMWIMTKEGIISKLMIDAGAICSTPFRAYFVIMVVVLIAGMIMEANANTVILAPICAQIGAGVGIDPFVMAFVILMTLCMGPVTPPVATALYAASVIGGEKIEHVAKHVWLFLAAEMVAIILIILFPVIIKFLPRMMGFEL